MVFTGRGLEVAKSTSPGEGDGSGAAIKAESGATVAPAALSERVTRLLASIEKELDSVESKIGGRMHVLDKDMDGEVSLDELQEAVRFLREQLCKCDGD